MRPFVSVILATKDRPRLLSLALRYYAHQTYPNRELLVIDDGEEHPVDPAAIDEVGGRLIRLESDTPLGTKMNLGIAEARGPLLQKMDDDDWYGPRYLETMVDAWLEGQSRACRPSIACVTPFHFFALGPWEIRREIYNNIPGASLVFDIELWRERPFRNVRRDEDVWFLFEQIHADTLLIPVDIGVEYMAVRHRGSQGDRGHTWTDQSGKLTLEEHIQVRPLQQLNPEGFLPSWALEVYRAIHQEIRAGVR